MVSATFDKDGATTHNLSGAASFTEISEGLLYREDVRWSGQEGTRREAYREYVYDFSNGIITLYYAAAGRKGAHFMNLALTDEGAIGKHLCGQDLYVGVFDFREGELMTSYTVKGPKKDCTIRTVYNRTSAKL